MPRSFPLTLFLLLFFACNNGSDPAQADEQLPAQAPTPGKIQVLNLGTFHMGYTPDANKTEFDENDAENKRRVHAIAEQLAAFDPTVIVVEVQPQYQEELEGYYAEYLADPDMYIEDPTEIELLAYEVGRLSGADRIYGIDHQMSYDYAIGEKLDNAVDSAGYQAFRQNPFRNDPELALYASDTISLREKLSIMNRDAFLDFLITVNADILTHTGTEGGFEGADEAAKYYQRNLRMYTNLNRLPLGPDDRVFIVMGATHTAFFRDFMSRSNKYEMVNTFEYL